jgi:two-component system sensor histidine kinase KdpD
MANSKAPAVRVVIEAVLSTGLTIVAAQLFQGLLSLANLAFLFLVPVIVVAGARGLFGGLLTAVFATLGFNFFFVPPAFTLHVADVDNLVTLLVLALTALLVSQVTARLKAQAMRAEALSLSAARLSALADDLASCATEAEVLARATAFIEDWTGAKLRVLALEEEAPLSPLDTAAARWAMAHKVEAGRGTEVMAGADALYVAVEGGPTPLVAQLWRGSGALPVAPALRDLVRQALSRTGVALHRVTVEARQQHDAMREAVLASIGHDLRTPLTSIVAGLAAMPPDAQGLLDQTRVEAARLDRLVTNILGLARLRSNAVSHAREAVDITDAVDAVLASLAKPLAGREVCVRLAPDGPLVRTDPRMLHHMLLNLIDNAAKFSASGSRVLIESHQNAEGLSLRIEDEGRGLPEGLVELPRRNAADSVQGSGLGLSVVTGYAAALDIGFHAANRADGQSGACMTLTFPPALLIDIAGRAP